MYFIQRVGFLVKIILTKYEKLETMKFTVLSEIPMQSLSSAKRRIKFP